MGATERKERKGRNTQIVFRHCPFCGEDRFTFFKRHWKNCPYNPLNGGTIRIGSEVIGPEDV